MKRLEQVRQKMQQRLLEREAEIVRRVRAGETISSIGQRFGITRQRVAQIWDKAEPSLRIKALRQAQQPLCEDCGGPLSGRDKQNKQSVCFPCRRQRRKRVITCIVCGKKRTIWDHASREKGIYCSKHCQGADLGRKYGFGANPQNSGHPQGFRASYCKRGHSLTDESNVYVYRRNGKEMRQCRACQRILESQAHWREKAMPQVAKEEKT